MPPEIRKARLSRAAAQDGGKALKPGQLTTQDDSKPAASAAASRAAAAAEPARRRACARGASSPGNEVVQNKARCFAGSGALGVGWSRRECAHRSGGRDCAPHVAPARAPAVSLAGAHTDTTRPGRAHGVGCAAPCRPAEGPKPPAWWGLMRCGVRNGDFRATLVEATRETAPRSPTPQARIAARWDDAAMATVELAAKT